MGQKLALKNEFAHVAVQLDHSANGVRLLIEDVRSGKTFYLDPLELESIAWSNHSDLKQILNPSYSRWKN